MFQVSPVSSAVMVPPVIPLAQRISAHVHAIEQSLEPVFPIAGEALLRSGTGLRHSVFEFLWRTYLPTRPANCTIPPYAKLGVSPRYVHRERGG